MKLWHKVIIGLLIGILLGYYLPEYAMKFKFIGDIFTRAIKLIISPLVFFSLVTGLITAPDSSSLGRVGIKAIIAFLTTTFFAVVFGLSVGAILKPGEMMNLPLIAQKTSTLSLEAKKFSIMQFLVDIIPENFLGAVLDGNVLQIVFVSIFTGIAINKLDKTCAEPIKRYFWLANKIILKMIDMVVGLSPYGAFALISWVIATEGVEVLFGLSKLIIAITIAMLLQYVVFGLLIKFVAKISPMPFYKKSFEYQALAFATSSSKASLATTMQVCREKLGISETSTSFLLPLGASINMDGFAINLGLTAMFFAQVFGIDLAWHQYLIIIFTATLGSIGGAGIPGASLIMMPMVLSAVNIPIEGVAILVGIDRILDMMRTVINITGDATITLLIDSSEGTLDKDKYFAP
jgi:Na+/H+-dicarboxylate symporter